MSRTDKAEDPLTNIILIRKNKNPEVAIKAIFRVSLLPPKMDCYPKIIKIVITHQNMVKLKCEYLEIYPFNNKEGFY